jgi:hypothetical protein
MVCNINSSFLVMYHLGYLMINGDAVSKLWTNEITDTVMDTLDVAYTNARSRELLSTLTL